MGKEDISHPDSVQQRGRIKKDANNDKILDRNLEGFIHPGVPLRFVEQGNETAFYHEKNPFL